jgi:hypothetical protein
MENDEVLPALKRQLACYQRLAKLARVQHEHVQNSRTEELLTVLSKRQKLLNQMADLEKIIAPAKRNWEEFLDGLPADQRAEAETLVRETRRLLEEIAAADRDDTIVLQQRKYNLGRGIGQASAARKFNHAYAKAAYGGGQSRTALDMQR